MKIINVEQGTDEWLEWRKSVITGTDAAIIMGSNTFPGQTLYNAWRKKLGLNHEMKSNAAMDEGRRLEPIAREAFIEKCGVNFIPTVVESTEFEFLGASLDGISANGGVLLEIKCGESSYKAAKESEIPAYYMDQMQHQLLVTGSLMCHYYCYREGKEPISMIVLPDLKWREEYLPRAREFWRLVALNEAPPMTSEDYRDMSKNQKWPKPVNRYIELDKIIKEAEEEKDLCRKEIIELCGDESCRGCGLKVIKGLTKGRIVYDDIPEIKGIDLEQYRKASTPKFTFLVERS